MALIFTHFACEIHLAFNTHEWVSSNLQHRSFCILILFRTKLFSKAFRYLTFLYWGGGVHKYNPPLGWSTCVTLLPLSWLHCDLFCNTITMCIYWPKRKLWPSSTLQCTKTWQSSTMCEKTQVNYSCCFFSLPIN